MWRPRRPRPATADDLRRLGIGDTFHQGGQAWHVVGRLDFDEVGVRWTELALDVERRVWLTVEDTDDPAFPDGLEVSWWAGVAGDLVTTGGPDDDLVVCAGSTYHLQHRGVATFTTAGTTGTPPGGRCDYADYRTAERELLGFEDYGDGWRTALGRIIPTGAVLVRD